jgi:hypothetical protein
MRKLKLPYRVASIPKLVSAISCLTRPIYDCELDVHDKKSSNGSFWFKRGPQTVCICPK